MPKYNFKAYSVKNVLNQEAYIILHDAALNTAFIVGDLSGKTLNSRTRQGKLALKKSLQSNPHFPLIKHPGNASVAERQQLNGIYQVNFDLESLQMDNLSNPIKTNEININSTMFRNIKANILKTFNASKVNFLPIAEPKLSDDPSKTDTSQLTSSYAKLNSLTNVEDTIKEKNTPSTIKPRVRVDTFGSSLPQDGTVIDLSASNPDENIIGLKEVWQPINPNVREYPLNSHSNSTSKTSSKDISDWQPINPNVPGHPLTDNSMVTPGNLESSMTRGGVIVSPDSTNNETVDDEAEETTSITPGSKP